MTELKKMTIHRALTELKMLHNRIDSARREVKVAVPNRKSNTKIDGMEIQGEFNFVYINKKVATPKIEMLFPESED